MALPRGQYPKHGRFGHGRAKPVQRFDPLVTTSTLADGTPAAPLGGKVSSSYLWSDTVSVSLSPTTNGGTVASFDSSDPPLSYADVRNGLGSKITYPTFVVGQAGSLDTGYEIDQSFIEFDTSAFFGPTSTTSGNTSTQYGTVTLDFTIPAFSDNTANDFVVQIWGDSLNANNIWSGTFGTNQFVTGTNLAFLSSITTPVATFNTSTISAGSTVSIAIPKTCLNTSGGKTRLLITSANNTNNLVPADFVYEFFAFVPKLTFNKFLTPTSTLFTTLNASNSGYVTANSVAGTVADILNGGAIRQATIGASVQVGVSQTNNQGYAGYVEFNTSNYIGTVSSAALSLSINTDNSVSDFGIEVYKLDYGTLTASDWVNPSSPALTLVGNVNTSELVDQSSITIPLSISSVSFNTPTRLLLYSSFIKAGVGNPVDNSYVNLTPTTLAITIASPIAGGPASTTLGAATSSASGSPVVKGTESATLANATGSAIGAPVMTGTSSSTLTDATASGAGVTASLLSGAPTLSDATSAATGSPVITGTAAAALSDATGAVSGAPIAAGTVTVTLGAATSSATAMSGFSPSQLSPVLWLDASDTATITQSANAVSSWLDKSTNARTFTQSTASAKPTTNTRTVNGKNVVDFDGNDILVGSGTTTDWKFLHDGTIYLIAAAFVLDTTTTTRYLLSSASTSLTTNGAQMVYGAETLNYYIGGTTNIRRALYNWGEPPIAVGSLEVVGVLGDPSQAAEADRIGLYADGYPVSKAGAGSGTLSTANSGQTLRVGGLSTTGSWDGAIAEIVVLTGANATDANWQKLNTYLATKWGGSTVIYTDLNFNFSVGSWGDLTFTGVSGAVTSVYTATATPGDITFNGNGGGTTVAAVLSGSPTLADATTTAVGSPVATGTDASSLGNATSSVAGSPIASATGATSLAAATASATARVVASGTATPALANATAVVTGTPIVVGTTTPSLGAATSNAVATTTILISGSSILGAATATGVLFAGSNTFALITLANATSSASATVISVATATSTLGPAIGNATGAPVVTSSGAVTLGAATGTAQAAAVAIGSVGVSLAPATASAQATIIASGAEASALSPATAAAVGSPIRTASGSPTLQNATAISLQSFPQTINNAQGTFVFSGFSSYSNSNVGVFTFTTVTGPTLGLITITAVSGRTQTGVISLSGNHPTPVAGPITVTQVLGEFTLEARSSRPSEGFPAVTAEFNLIGASRPPEITKHLAVWDGEWKIARFKEWSGSGWVESPRVKAYGVSGDFWEKVF